MAKREFIDKAEIKDRCITYIESSGATMNLIDLSTTMTEEDIVKPYLTKLKAKMFDLPKAECKTYWDAVDDIGDMIDNLLSEQGDTE